MWLTSSRTEGVWIYQDVEPAPPNGPIAVSHAQNPLGTVQKAVLFFFFFVGGGGCWKVLFAIGFGNLGPYLGNQRHSTHQSDLWLPWTMVDSPGSFSK